jgi:hypothetical protein
MIGGTLPEGIPQPGMITGAMPQGMPQPGMIAGSGALPIQPGQPMAMTTTLEGNMMV